MNKQTAERVLSQIQKIVIACEDRDFEKKEIIDGFAIFVDNLSAQELNQFFEYVSRKVEEHPDSITVINNKQKPYIMDEDDILQMMRIIMHQAEGLPVKLNFKDSTRVIISYQRALRISSFYLLMCFLVFPIYSGYLPTQNENNDDDNNTTESYDDIEFNYYECPHCESVTCVNSKLTGEFICSICGTHFELSEENRYFEDENYDDKYCKDNDRDEDDGWDEDDDWSSRKCPSCKAELFIPNNFIGECECPVCGEVFEIVDDE